MVSKWRNVIKYKPSLSLTLKMGCIPGWSIIASEENCPCATDICSLYCYAKKRHFLHNKVINKLINNSLFSRTVDFVPWMCFKLGSLDIPVFRIHVSGDFYSVEYIEKWRKIVTERSEIAFFTYTRSWTDSEMLKALLKLAKLHNMYMWFSADRDNWTSARQYKNVHWAFMVVDDHDYKLFENSEFKPDILFRVSHKQPLKEMHGIVVCPYENGVKTKERIKCDMCGLCWNKFQPQARDLKLRNFNRVIKIGAEK
ncbi:MAG: hypothetical protein KatS3mg083_622 [Candidatus Dojkabacteria bacterium]|nr:MAG: hypothetical protein KatS3mg083_622 [Candidatus Dojkabacteria bacterium]